jgi:hypothetical protein
MVFSPPKLLFRATLLLSSLTGLTHAEDREPPVSACDNGPWTDVSSTGALNGQLWCQTKYTDGIIITGIEAWATDDEVTGLQFYYSDGKSGRQYGKANGGKRGRLDWDPAVVRISQVKTWGNGNAKSLGRVYIRTTDGRELDIGKDTSGQDAFETNVASGVMLGAFGNSGWIIDRLGFLFLKSEVINVSVDDIVFADTPENLNARRQYDSPPALCHMLIAQGLGHGHSRLR